MPQIHSPVDSLVYEVDRWFETLSLLEKKNIFILSSCSSKIVLKRDCGQCKKPQALTWGMCETGQNNQQISLLIPGFMCLFLRLSRYFAMFSTIFRTLSFELFQSLSLTLALFFFQKCKSLKMKDPGKFENSFSNLLVPVALRTAVRLVFFCNVHMDFMTHLHGSTVHWTL